MDSTPRPGADPFPLFHLADLDFDLSADSISSLHPYQLALAHLNPDWDSSFGTKVKQAWRKKREKARKDITNKAPMGVYATREEQEKEGSVFARFELIDLGFEVVKGELEALTSAQLAIFFNRRERDFALDLSPPSVGSISTAAVAAASGPVAAPLPNPTTVDPPPLSRLPSTFAAPPPAATPLPANPNSRLPARRAPPPPPPHPASTSSSGRASATAAQKEDSFEPLPFGLPGLAPVGTAHKKEESPLVAVKQEGDNSSPALSAEEKAKQLREREKELYRRLKEEQKRAGGSGPSDANEGKREEGVGRSRSREREREKRDSPGRSRKDGRDERDRERRRSRSRSTERERRRDKDHERDRERERRRSRSRSRSPAGYRSARRDSVGLKSTPSSHRLDRERDDRCDEVSRKRSRDDERDRLMRGASPARSDVVGSSNLRSSVRRRVDDIAPASTSMYPARRERSRSRTPVRRAGTPPPSMPEPHDDIPLSLQDTLSVLFLRHFPADCTPGEIVTFLHSLFPPTPSRLPQHQPPVPLAIKIVKHRGSNLVPGTEGVQPVSIAFVVFETRDEALTVLSILGAAKASGKNQWRGIEVTGSWGRDSNKPLWRFDNFPSSFVESFYQRQLAAFAARKSNPHATSSSRSGPLPPPAPPAGMSDANLGPLGGGLGGGGDGETRADKQDNGPTVPAALQMGLFVLRLDNLPEEATLAQCRDFFDGCEGLLGLSLSGRDFGPDRVRHAWLAFGKRRQRDEARNKLTGVRFPNGKMKLFYQTGEDWATKTGERHDWSWSKPAFSFLQLYCATSGAMCALNALRATLHSEGDMSKEFRTKHADEYKLSMSAAGLPVSPTQTQTRSSVSSGAPPPASSYERDRVPAGNDTNGDVFMRDAPHWSLQQQQPQRPFSLPSASPSYVGSFDPRRPGPSPSMLPQHAPRIQQRTTQEYSPNQPMLNLTLGSTFPPHPQAAFIEGNNAGDSAAYGSYGQAWHPDAFYMLASGAGMPMMPPAASYPLPMQDYPSIPPPQAFPATNSLPIARPLAPPSTAPTGPAADMPKASPASSSMSGGIHPARLAMLAASGGEEEAGSHANRDVGSGNGGAGGERLDAATEKKIVEETQRNAWGARKFIAPTTPEPEPASPAFTPAPAPAPVAGSSHSLLPPPSAPTAPPSFTVKGLANSPPTGPAATLSSSAGAGPSSSPTRQRGVEGSPSSANLNAEVVAQPPSLAARSGVAAPPMNGTTFSVGASGPATEEKQMNGTAATAAAPEGLTPGQRRKLLEKQQYEAQKRARQQEQQQQN
ncbi:hypothetical protein JCM11251_004965 [Rhodosporidiobolus azoricus]